MALTASKLRENIYGILDLALATGEPVEIEHNGHRLLIVADEQTSRLSRLVNRTDVVVGDSADFIHLEWSNNGKGDPTRHSRRLVAVICHRK